MDLLQLGSSRWALVIALLLSLSNYGASLDIEYCSSLNTASTSANSSIYQSNGLCHDFCYDDYAFAIVQSSDCWCSNYVPKPTVDSGKCDSQCPGFPDDLCGADGLYGYIALSVKPSGTVSRTVSSTHSSTSSTSTRSSSTSSTRSTSSTWTPTPVESLQTVTGGAVKTVTVTPTAPASSSAALSSKSTSQKLGTGGIAGLTIGLVALAGIIGALLFFWLRRRRQQEAEEKAPSRGGSSAGMGGQVPSRTMSENSRYVLGTDGRQVVETWEPSDTPGSRRSRLVPVDPRLDPFAPVYQRGDGNVSRESINTLRDDHDYSRRVHQKGPILRATNPDE